MNALDVLVRRVDEDRWLASRFAPSQTRARLVAVYAVNHEMARVAEATREPRLGAIRLQWWRDALHDVGKAAAHPALQALKDTGADAGVYAALRNVADARAADLQSLPFADWRALEAYADATAGALIGAAMTVCETPARHEAQNMFVEAAGRAWALTGLLRAAPFWQARGATPLPEGATASEALARAEAAYATCKQLSSSLPGNAFPAVGYVATVPGYLRALRAGRGVTSPFVRRIVLVAAAATGKF